MTVTVTINPFELIPLLLLLTGAATWCFGIVMALVGVGRGLVFLGRAVSGRVRRRPAVGPEQGTAASVGEITAEIPLPGSEEQTLSLHPPLPFLLDSTDESRSTGREQPWPRRAPHDPETSS
ncbi:hypothetical protein [Streptomyces sp. MP131-18]|uniref:hypothetical protein n=1 Tax=Streptomyces sp. MP131-18 TaxID=1857892 RepID=UPI00097BF6C3|nr:hypothetical protein [Streptomyces sp. MP131-18]ONK13087.1 hypothetical protein STBA_38490 [Streptomyces sp. MP131-18]